MIGNIFEDEMREVSRSPRLGIVSFIGSVSKLPRLIKISLVSFFISDSFFSIY